MKRTVSLLLLIALLVGCSSHEPATPPGGEPEVENVEFVPGEQINPPKGCKEMRERNPEEADC